MSRSTRGREIFVDAPVPVSQRDAGIRPCTPFTLFFLLCLLLGLVVYATLSGLHPPKLGAGEPHGA